MTASQKLLVIGGSAGSLDVLFRTLPKLEPSLNVPVIVVIHRKRDSDAALVDLLAGKTRLRVKEAEDKEELRGQTIYLAPADYHLLIEKDWTFALDFSEKVNHCRPSIDVTFETAAEAYKHNLTCLLLSGANADGVKGLLVVKNKNGQACVQSPESSEVPYMPQYALSSVQIDKVLDISQISTFINTLGNY